MNKKPWEVPSLDMLDVTETAGGPNGCVPDRNGRGANNRDSCQAPQPQAS
ncbi:hypothetical protein DFQ01_106177 [Paenibacillus cellulosilyticus]|uniref:Paeninodin family lasso peptide n=1 Tax=Paenibacillus cellulosilyticus TaxID=375489 RepID=A0A2V2YYS9_9BACL|nr:paeninodin family lasso peptide [Paenibacillus cellulosilyticus]PWW04892.1 hypothetical protein DFQ01_106177 [Paenibacillus cellulosilyticus]QKS45998.1 paeninodin family lasso peptide [Paenibacillus cellulosilyticus]